MEYESKINAKQQSEYYKFTYNGLYYIYIVDDMKAYRINSLLYEEIENYENKIDIKKFSNDVKEVLLKLNILHAFTSLGKKQKKDSMIKENFQLSRISLNVAQLCNMKCIYCYGEEGEYGEIGLMNEKVALKSVDFLLNNSGNRKNISINFFGGEPLLNFPIIKKVVKYANKKTSSLKKINYTITTNGTLFTDEITKFLNKYNFGVQVSFDGTKEIQDKNRPLKSNNSSYDIIVPNLKKFIQSRNGNLAVRGTLTKYSVPIDGIRKHLMEFGFRKINLTPVTANENTEFKLTKKNYNSIYEDIELLADEFLVNIKEGKILEDNILTKILKGLFTKQKVNFTCGAGKGMLSISMTGKLFPCHRFVGDDNYKLGDLNEIYYKNKNLFLKSQIEPCKECSNCWAKYLCGGNCYHENLTMNNSIYIPYQPSCEYIKKVIELAIYIMDKMNKDEKIIFKMKYLNYNTAHIQ